MADETKRGGGAEDKHSAERLQDEQDRIHDRTGKPDPKQEAPARTGAAPKR